MTRARRPFLLGLAVLAASGSLSAGKEMAFSPAQLGRRALVVLSSAMRDGRPETRAAAAAAWGRIGNKAALPLLVKALKDPDALVRVEAAFSLHELGDSRGFSALEAELRPPRSPEGELTAVSELKLMARNEVRVKAVQRLSEIGGEHAVALLEKTLKDPSGAVRDATAEALARLGFDEFFRQFLDALKDQDPSVRSAAASALGRIGRGDEALAGLKDAAGDSSEMVRAEVMRALGNFPGAGSVEVLRRGLSDNDTRVRSQALASLSRFDDPGSVALLRDALQKPAAPEAKLKALAGLARRGESVTLDLASAALGEKDADLRRLALEVLAAAGTPASTELLRRVMGSDSEMRLRVEAAELLIKRFERGKKRA